MIHNLLQVLLCCRLEQPWSILAASLYAMEEFTHVWRPIGITFLPTETLLLQLDVSD